MDRRDFIKKTSLVTLSTFLGVNSAFGTDSTKSDDRLEVIVASSKPLYKVGETPDVLVGIKNVSRLPITLVYALDSSTNYLRLPLCRVLAYDDAGNDIRRETAICGNYNGYDDTSMFKEVVPGEIFNPFELSPILLEKELGLIVFPKSGLYTVEFQYHTNSKYGLEWGLEGRDAEALLSKVPKNISIAGDAKLRVV